MTNHTVTLVVDQFAPEGLGIGNFWKIVLSVPEDVKVLSDVCIAWKPLVPLPPKGHKIWMRNVEDLGSFPEPYTFDTHSFWMHLPTRQMPQVLHHLELFAGGFGGWTAALRMLMQISGHKSQFVGIEHDHHVARTFALTHHACFSKPCGMMPLDVLSQFDGNWIICADVMDFSWCPAIAAWGVDFVSISFPCGPWSGATEGPGLNDPAGQLLFHAMLQTRFLRPQCIGFENVSGFHRHPQKALLSRLLVMIGYKFVWEHTVDVRDKLGLVRSRWLALAVRINGITCPTPLPPWPKGDGMHDHSQFVLEHLPGHAALALTQQAWNFATDKQFLSWKLIKELRSPEEVLQSRTYGDHQVLPTFMAMYGRQHELPEVHLAKHGYLGHFRKADEGFPYGVRYWHPAEIALLHGVVDCVYVDEDLNFSWMVMGNLITITQAAMVLVPAVEYILNCTLDRQHFCDEFQLRRMKAADTDITLAHHGLFLTPKDQVLTEAFLASVPQLFHLNHNGDLWIPAEGIARVGESGRLTFDIPLDFGLCKQPCIGCIDVSSSPEPTQGFAVLCPVSFANDVNQIFRFASTLTHVIIEKFWGHQMRFQESDRIAGTFEFHPAQERRPEPVLLSGVATLLLRHDDLQILASDPDKPLIDQDFSQELPDDMFDLFGPIHKKHKPTEEFMLLPVRITHGSFQGNLLELFQNFARVDTQCSWMPDSDTFLIHIMGPEGFCQPVVHFWSQVLTQMSCIALGRRIGLSHETCGTKVSFDPLRFSGICPPMPFRFALAICAARVLMDALPKTPQNTFPVAIKWLGRTLWEGELPVSFNVGILIQFMKFALTPVCQHVEWRLVSRGKQIPFDATLHSIGHMSHTDCNNIALIKPCHGGAPAKHQQKIYQQSSLAAVLLEFGYELSWISKTCEQLLNKYSIAKIQNITMQTSSNAKVTAILNLCREAAIDIPTPVKPSTRQPPSGAPWRPKKAKTEEILNPQDFQILPGFFTNVDGTPTEQISMVKPQSAGLCLMLPEQAMPFLTGERISTDELGILIVGNVLGKPEIAQHKMVFPCYNPHKQMVLVTGTLIQLGSREIRVQQGDPQQVQAEECSLLALTAFRSDWSDDDWMVLTTKPIPFLREIFAKAGHEQTVLSMWGKSLKSGRAAASPNQAETMQIHCSVVKERLHRFLSKSGFNSIFATPKQADGRLDATFRIIWLKEDMQTASVQAMKTQNCLGLVRGKNTLGLRYATADYDRAWSVLCPGQEKPDFVTGDLIFKAEGLPFGTTAKMIVEWSAKIAWPCSPIRALVTKRFARYS